MSAPDTQQTELPAHLSYSQVATYGRCGEQYRLERLCRAPQEPSWALAGGSAVHSATEEWDRAYMEGTVRDDFADLWVKHFTEQIEDTVAKSGSQPEAFRASGRVSKDWPNKRNQAWWDQHGPIFLARWSSWRLHCPWEIWIAPNGEPAIELAFEVEIGGVPVKGSIDRIFTVPNMTYVPGAQAGLITVDIKTGAKPDSTLQLGTYAKAMRDQLGVDIPDATYWMAETGGTPQIFAMAKYTDKYLDYIYGGARKGMEAGIFLPKTSNMCGACGVRESCFAFGGANADQYSPFSA